MELRVYDADPERVERIRARCVAALERRRESERRGSRGPAWRTWLEPAVAVGVCMLYLADALGRALAVFR
jgi:hypothetical protein